MKALLTLFLSLIISNVALAQCYEIHQRPFYPDPYTGGLSTGIEYDDVHSEIVDLGFEFCFFGDTVSQAVISSNGYITFDTSYANQYSPWSINAGVPDSANVATHFSIMGPYQDILPSVAMDGDIRYATYGVQPYRRFVVSYDQIPMFSCNDMLFTNQMVIYESLNVIDINIVDKPLCGGWNNGAAIEGIQNQDGTVAYTVQGRNFPDQWTAQNDSYRFVPTCDCPTDSLPEMSLVPGKVYWDMNGDCEQDANEMLIPNIRIDIQPNNGVVWTNQNGEFAIMMEPGQYSLEHSPMNLPYYVNVCNPDPIELTVVADSNALDVIFGDTISPFYDIQVGGALNGVAACFPSSGLVNVCNNGNVPVGDLDLLVQISPFVLVDSTDLNFLSDSTWTAHIDTLGVGECTSFHIYGSVLCDSIILDQVACFGASVTLLEDEIDSTNNSVFFCGNILASYDPNDKRVQAQNLEEGWLTEEYIDQDDELTYKIRFQNTGTGPAYNVIIHDELSEYLDPLSIDPVIASHDYYMQMIDGVLSIHFLGIELPDSASDPLGSQGFIVFNAKQNPGNVPGTIIENQAEIYFDFNTPVATNTTVNEIPLFISVDDLEENELVIYPNPVLDQLTIDLLNQDLFDVMILDVHGRPLKSITDGSEKVRIDVSDLDRGTYLIQISTNENQIIERFIKR